MLHLYEKASPDNFAQADAICTGLQLTNFWQDIAIDWRKNRSYLPRDKRVRHGVSEDCIAEQTQQAAALDHGASKPALSEAIRRHAGWQALMQEQVGQAHALLRSGLPLTRRLPGRIGFELRLVVQGGLRILERLEQLHYDMFFQRPTLAKSDWVLLFWRALG